MFNHIGDNRGVCDRWGADSHLTVTADQQDAVKGDWLPRLNGQALDGHFVACGDAILFASGFQNCVHKFVFPQRGRG